MRLIRLSGKGMDLSSILGLLSGKANVRCQGPGGEVRSCDECPLQGHCPTESLVRQLRGEKKNACADGTKDADLLLADAKMAGQKAQVEYLENVVSALREKIDRMAAKHKVELEQLTVRHKEDVERLSRVHGGEVEDYRRAINRTNEVNNALHGQFESARQVIDKVQGIIASNGHKRPSRGFLATLRKALGMPPLEKPKDAPATT